MTNLVRLIIKVIDLIWGQPKTALPDPVQPPPAPPEAEQPAPPEDAQEPAPAPAPKPKPAPAPNRVPRYLWLLDPGHGLETPGKRSPAYPDGLVVQEAVIVRKIMRRLHALLNEAGVHHDIVVRTEKDIPLGRRTDWANKRAERSSLPCIFVSIHSNAAPGDGWQQASGVEAWHFHSSQVGRRLANAFANSISWRTGFKNRGTKSRANSQFFVLRETKMPATLIEVGFHNHYEEARKLADPAYQEEIADAMLEAILYFERYGL